MTFKYDPADRLFSVTATGGRRFLYDGDNLIAEYNGGGTLLRRYAHGGGTDNPILCENGGAGATQKCLAAAGAPDAVTMLADERGSVSAYLDASTGALVTSNLYDAFGRQHANNDGTFRYTGQTWLYELALYNYKARLYDPDTGRFLQIDPIGYEADMNMYAYAFNDPLKYSDPSGNIPLDTILDVGFLLYDVGALGYDEFFNGGANRQENITAILADAAGTAAPYATGFGVASRLGDDVASAAFRSRHFTGVAKQAKWQKSRQGVDGPGLRGHFKKHGDDIGVKNAKQYDISARDTIQNGKKFKYRDRSTDEQRIGYFNEGTGLFTATSQLGKKPRIHTHFRPEGGLDELRRLPGFTWNP